MGEIRGLCGYVCQLFMLLQFYSSIALLSNEIKMFCLSYPPPRPPQMRLKIFTSRYFAQLLLRCPARSFRRLVSVELETQAEKPEEMKHF